MSMRFFLNVTSKDCDYACCGASEWLWHDGFRFTETHFYLAVIFYRGNNCCTGGEFGSFMIWPRTWSL
jgi:hypothetical protein